MKNTVLILAIGSIVSGLVLLSIGSIFVFSADIVTPPISAGWIIGMLFFHGGLAIFLTLLSRKQMSLLLFPAVLSTYGMFEINLHPLEVAQCTCPIDTFGRDCTPCIGDPTCSGHGVCDDGYNGSGLCLCDSGWSGIACDRCKDNFLGPDCNHCKRGWKMPECDECYPGYVGKNCDLCDTRWENRHGECVCKPGHYGKDCKQCDDCTAHGDTLAICTDNDYLVEKFPQLKDLPDTYGVQNPSVCTPSGEACWQDDDCTSGRCRSRCEDYPDLMCSRHDHCPTGLCSNNRVCCVETEESTGICKCGRTGYWGPKCEMCPGFDGIFSSTICSGKGTCAAKYAGNKYVNLICMCEEGWSGELCGCKSGPFGCTECAPGFFGIHCDQCPGGSRPCHLHGQCSDGISGDGTCTCDLDLKSGGLGGWDGNACDACFGEFWGNRCKPCPGLKELGASTCSAEGFTTFIPSGNCIKGCFGNINAPTCNDGYQGDGTCK